MTTANVRAARLEDLDTIRAIYNDGVHDRIATLESGPKSHEEMLEWWEAHDDRYAILVATENDAVVGWASLNRFSHRCAHAAIADLSIYIARARRGCGIGSRLLPALAERATANGFHKIVLHALNDNEAGKRLYRKTGFREVGVFREHGTIDGKYVDVVAMERLL
jgi:L-amino acid N-acyltransferase YncA